MVVGITFSSFDLFHAGHVLMLKEAKTHCDHLIAAIQTDPSIDRPDTKNKPIQSIVERQIQVSGCKYVDSTLLYATEEDLKDILKTMDIHYRIIGVEYKDKPFTGKDICEQRGIGIVYNSRDHNWSTTELRKRIIDKTV
jgi:glycerol-3-phosphate cytidylyltransferase